jgi:hypothetical protein
MDLKRDYREFNRITYPLNMDQILTNNSLVTAPIAVLPAAEEITEENILGYYAGVWVKQNTLKAGATSRGHKHTKDHLSLLTQGTILVQVEGLDKPKEFTAPTFIVIRKEHNHNFTALTNATWFCVFSVLDVDNINPDENIFNPATNDPLADNTTPVDVQQKIDELDAKTSVYQE